MYAAKKKIRADLTFLLTLRIENVYINFILLDCVSRV